MRYFYFSKDDKKLCYDDNRVIKAGITHKVGGEHGLCGHGLHASKNIIDALRYAPGNHLWIVELSGEVVHCRDKSYATERKYICGANIEKILNKFAREQALVNIKLIKPHCTNENYDLVVKWLETGDETLRCTVRDIADGVLCATAYSAARNAARNAAYSVYWVAYYAVDNDNAANVAYSAASNATRAANAAHCAYSSNSGFGGKSAANERLISMLPQRLRNAIIGEPQKMKPYKIFTLNLGSSTRPESFITDDLCYKEWADENITEDFKCNTSSMYFNTLKEAYAAMVINAQWNITNHQRKLDFRKERLELILDNYKKKEVYVK